MTFCLRYPWAFMATTFLFSGMAWDGVLKCSEDLFKSLAWDVLSLTRRHFGVFAFDLLRSTWFRFVVVDVYDCESRMVIKRIVLVSMHTS
jgi:hypothetical protein